MKARTVVFTLIAVVCLVSAAFAAPQKVNFQGKLTDAAGNPINTSVSMTFTIYDHATSTDSANKLWTETQTVTVTNGIYNVLLGASNAIDTELTETKALWLGVKVGSDAEMSPRVALTPGVYAMIMLNTITVKDGAFTVGNIEQTVTEFSLGGHSITMKGIKDHSSFPYLQLRDENNTRAFYLGWGSKSGKRIDWRFENGYNLSITAGRVNIAGTLYVSGADLAEPFDMTDIASLELGDVVVIDPLNPLHVTKSTTAYDTTVAGIVSSTTQAGYVAGSRSDGSSDKPIALVGRVLCNVSAENGAIKIGDLLTTSNTPGYAMKATDFEKRQGAILGKALQAFDGDKGQILVLVTLQ